jgi:hypothetical protein
MAKASKGKGKGKGAKKGGRSKAKRAAASKPRKKKGKLTPAGRKRIAAASRARWKARKGAGKPGKGNHIPLHVLEKNHKNLGLMIETRKKSKASWA